MTAEAPSSLVAFSVQMRIRFWCCACDIQVFSTQLQDELAVNSVRRIPSDHATLLHSHTISLIPATKQPAGKKKSRDQTQCSTFECVYTTEDHYGMPTLAKSYNDQPQSTAHHCRNYEFGKLALLTAPGHTTTIVPLLPFDDPQHRNEDGWALLALRVLRHHQAALENLQSINYRNLPGYGTPSSRCLQYSR